MNNDTQASLLAQWLEHPGTPPPQGLDSDVVEAAVVLRPELAPPASVSLDDILAGVTTGPFAAAAVGSPVVDSLRPDPELAPVNVVQAPERGAQVIDLASRRRRRIWGGLGVVAAAALVMVTVLPNLGQLDAPADQAQALPGAEQQLGSPAPARQAEPAQDFAPLAGEFEGGVNVAPDLEQSRKLDWRTSAPASAPQRGAGQNTNPPPAPPPAPSASKKANAPLVSSSGGASYGDVEEEELVQGQDQPSVVERSGSSYESVSLDEARRERKDRFSLRGGSSKEQAASADALADDFAYEDADEPTAPETLPESLEGLRSAAVPRDYRGGWYLTALDGGAYDRFVATLNSGQGMSSGDKAKTYGAMISDPDPRVGQDMAFRAATASRSAGDTRGALIYLRQGQRLSSLNTPQRANLYYLEGQLLEASGDTSGALAAYKVAANLNQAR